MSLTKETKWNNWTIDQINQEINEMRKEITIIKIKNKTKQTIKPHKLKIKKHYLAQLLTFKTLKQTSRN